MINELQREVRPGKTVQGTWQSYLGMRKALDCSDSIIYVALLLRSIILQGRHDIVVDT